MEIWKQMWVGVFFSEHSVFMSKLFQFKIFLKYLVYSEVARVRSRDIFQFFSPLQHQRRGFPP